MERVAGHDRVDPLDRDEVLGTQHRRGVRDERRAERVDAPARDRQPRRRAVAAVAQQVGARRVEAAEQVERGDRAPRARALVAVERDEHRRPVVALGDPRGDDPDHAGMPAVGGQHERGGVGAGGARLGDLPLGLEQDPRLHVAALDVDRVELGGHGAGAVEVRREQQLEPRVGAVQPPGGVDPRRQPEPDRPGVHPARVDARHLHQRLQPGLAGRGEHAQARAHEPAVLPHERDAVGDGGQRDDVEVGVRRGGIHARPLEQRPREHVRHARRTQLRTGVSADARVHDRRVRQPAVGARRVMVGDHDVHARRAGRGDLLHRRDRAVHRDEQPRPARGEPLDGGEREPVAVVDPARQVPVDVGAQRPQRADEHRRRAHAVHVVVAVHGDPRPALHVREDLRGALAQAAERVRRMAHVGVEERPRERGVREPAPHQHLRDDVRDAQRGAQPLGGGVVVRGDIEAGVGHRSVTVRAAPDGIGAFAQRCSRAVALRSRRCCARAFTASIDGTPAGRSGSRPTSPDALSQSTAHSSPRRPPLRPVVRRR